MASRQKKGDGSIIFVIGMAVVLLIFSIFHFMRLMQRDIIKPQVRRGLDIGTNWRVMIKTGSLALIYVLSVGLDSGEWPYSLILTVHLGLYVLNWVGKAQTHTSLGVLRGSQKGEVSFIRTSDSLNITDCLMALPVLRNPAGKSVFLRGGFGSRRNTFSDKLKHAECIHLMTT